MRLSSITFLLLPSVSVAFNPKFGMKRIHSLALFSSAADALNQRKAALADEGSQLFNDSLMQDMRETLLLLEKRTKEGPLTVAEVDDFEARTQRILVDMKEQGLGLADRGKPGEKAALLQATTPEEAQRIARELEAKENARILAAQKAAGVVPEQLEVAQEQTEVASSDDNDDDEEEYSEAFGMAPGTRNTYAIEGMEEMEPEEYRKALQESVLEKQRQRRKEGKLGNYGTVSYLNYLGGGNDPTVLKKDAYEGDDGMQTSKNL